MRATDKDIRAVLAVLGDAMKERSDTVEPLLAELTAMSRRTGEHANRSARDVIMWMFSLVIPNHAAISRAFGMAQNMAHSAIRRGRAISRSGYLEEDFAPADVRRERRREAQRDADKQLAAMQEFLSRQAPQRERLFSRWEIENMRPRRLFQARTQEKPQ